MRFAKQRALIFACMLLVPLSATLAILQTPVMSDLLLGVALRFARFRTGLRVEARGWEVNPFTFSASLKDIRFRHEQLVVHAPTVWVQLSPISLIFGNIHLRDFLVEDPLIRGRFPKEWLDASTRDDSSEAPWGKDLPTWLGRNISEQLTQLESQHLMLDDGAIRGLRIEADPIRLERFDLELSNLELGQARLRWLLEGLEWKQRLRRTQSVSGSITLLRESAKTYYLTLGALRLRLGATERDDVSIDGRFPGQVNFTLDLNGEELSSWLRASPLIADPKSLDPIEGKIFAEGRLQLGKEKLVASDAELSLENFRYGGYVLAGLKTRIQTDAQRTTLTNIAIRLPAFPGDRVPTGGSIRSSELVIEDKKLRGVLNLDHASVCSIQLAADSKDCYSAVSVDGTITAEGTVDPFEVRASLKTKMVGESYISGDALYKTPPELEPVVRLGPADFTAQVLVRAKYLIIEASDISQPDGMSLRTEGRIDYKPTVVDLRAAGTQMPLDKFTREIIGFRWGGRANANGRIQYSMLIPESEGRTKVDTQLVAKDLEFEGQRLGDANGPFTYAGDSFRIGPVLLRSGGGSAEVEGRIQMPTNAPSRMNLKGRFSRLELVSRLPQSGKEAFRGLVSGQAELSGGMKAKDVQNFLSGPIQVTFDAARLFGIPFEAGGIRARYDKRILQIQQAKALRGRAVVSVQGRLNPDGGSELTFRSEDFLIRDTELHPFFQNLESGRTSFEGFWRPQEGWAVNGRLRDLKIAGQALPEGNFNVSGSEDLFRMRVKLPDALEASFEERGIDPKTSIESLRGFVKDSGLYAGLAYLKDWRAPSRVETKGRVDFDLARNAGEIRFGALEFRGPVGVDGRLQTLLKTDSGQIISWENGRVRRVAVSSSEPEPWSLKAAPGDSAATFNGRFSAPFVDLFVPTIGLKDGRVTARGSVPMPPDFATLSVQGALENGVVLVDTLGAPATGVSAQLSMERGRLNISEGVGRMGPGEIQVSGGYKFDPVKPGLSLRAKFNRARAILLKDLPFEATGEVLLSGEGRPWTLSGEVLVQNGLYSKEFGADEGGEAVAVRDPFFKLNLGVEIGGRFAVRNSLLSSEIAGRLNVAGTDVNPLLRGKIDLVPNGILYARDNEFRIARGNVLFTGAEGNVPVVSLEANSTVKADRDYRIQLGVSGPTDRLDFTFSSDPALPTQDIVMLLAFGFTRPDESLEATSEEGLIRNAQWQALQLLFGNSLGKNLDRTTGFQIRVQNQQSTNASQTGRTTVPKVTVHRKLTERMSAVYGKALDGSKEQDLQVDYRLFKNVNISGVWEEPEPTKSSLGVDLRFKFDVK